MKDCLHPPAERGRHLYLMLQEPLYTNPQQSILNPLNQPAVLNPETCQSVTPVVLRKLRNIDLWSGLCFYAPAAS